MRRCSFICDDCAHFDEVGGQSILWIFHCKLNLDGKCRYSALSLHLWYTHQKRLMCCIFVNIGILNLGDPSCYFNPYKAILMLLIVAIFKVFICKNRKLPFLCLKHRSIMCIRTQNRLLCHKAKCSNIHCSKDLKELALFSRNPNAKLSTGVVGVS